jgi:alpha-methylacyl-CoA racemase
MTTNSKGPLAGVRVLEMSAIGPVPFAGMVLADMGADVVRVDRPGTPEALPGVGRGADVLGRGKRSVTVDLKHADGATVVLELVKSADVLLEGLRPGVMERLGVGPDECLAVNERLVYGRMTGFGQDGPLASEAGHDINYISVAGVLSRIGRAGAAPVPPLNLVGDFGGGAMFLVTGVLGALLERATSGRGQVVDAAMIDGAALLTAGTFSGVTQPARGEGVLDGGSPFYDAYETSDGKFLSAGPIEPRFWANFVAVLELDPAVVTQERATWPASKAAVAAAIATKTRDQWTALFAGTDSCVAAVLEPAELFDHPHHKAREGFVEVDGVLQPAPAPRFSRSVSGAPGGAPANGSATDDVLAAAGLPAERTAELRAAGVVGA